MDIGHQDKVKALQQAIKKQQTKDIYEIGKDLMGEFPDDLDYQECWAIAGLKMEKFDDVGQVLFKEAPKAGSRFESLYAYYLYATANYQKCIALLERMKSSPSSQLLLSQCYFKTAQYQPSIAILNNLLTTPQLAQETKQTYFANMLAAYDQPIDSIVKEWGFLLNGPDACREIFYNYALLLADKEDWVGMEKYLTKFQSTLMQDDDLDRVTVRLLRDYACVIRGQLKDERKTIRDYEKMLENIKNKNIHAVLTNNLIYLQGNEEGLTDTAKQINQFFHPSYKISKSQALLLKINQMSLLLRKNRLTETIKLMKQIQQLSSPAFLLHNFNFVKSKYYALKKSKDFKAIDELIQSLLGIEESGLAFCLLADTAREKESVKEMFDSLGEASKWNNPVIQNYIFSQLIASPTLFQEHSEQLEKMIAKTNDIKVLEILLKVYESKKNEEKQRFILEKILNTNPKNIMMKMKLARIYMNNCQFTEAEEMLKGVEGPQQISDMGYLQNIEKNIHISVKKDEQIQEIEHRKDPNKKKIKKKRRARLPKNIEKFVEGYKGDPERWLPKWQRKGYKKKGKRMGGKTQGLSTVGQEEKNVYTVGSSTSAKQVSKQQKKRR